MEDEIQVEGIIPAADEAKPGKFKPGHAKVGGRKKQSKTWAARALAEEAGFHPVKIAMDVILTGKLPAIKGRVSQVVSDKDRLAMLHEILPYLMPKLSSTALTGADNGPVAIATLDVTELMKDPELAAVAQQLALAWDSANTNYEAGEERETDWNRIDGQKLLE